MGADETSIPLRCRCGTVCGEAVEVRPRSVNRAICYCDDCQAFAHHLRRADLLDPQGGSDIVQLAPATVRISQGHDHIAGLRLSAGGLHRWYAACCKTPLGNHVSPAIPFVGIVLSSFDLGSRDAARVFGPPIGAIKGEFAIGAPPPGSRGIRLPILLRSVAKVLGWRIAGKAWPHPFIDRTTGRPIYPETVLSPEQRDALRALCGRTPARPATS